MKGKKSFLPYICFAVLIVFVLQSKLFYVSGCDIYSSVLRFHVLAHSDSQSDQNIKYLVRDAILEKTGFLFSDCKTVEEALKTAEKNKHLILKAANEVLCEHDSEHEAKIIIGKEHYPEKVYGSLIFPEGEYLSVRVLIGEGNGKNWWCVLYPPLCNLGVVEDGKLLSDYNIDNKQIEELKAELEENSCFLFGTHIKLKFLEYLT